MLHRTLVALALLACTLACGGAGGPSEEAYAECTPAADGEPCETCFMMACQEQCYTCVDDPVCYGCINDEGDPAACQANQPMAELITCALGSIGGDCKEECGSTPPPDPTKPPKFGKGRKGGKGGKGRKGQ